VSRLLKSGDAAGQPSDRFQLVPAYGLLLALLALGRVNEEAAGKAPASSRMTCTTSSIQTARPSAASRRYSS
jgi:hypothetical protein